jgi:predicted enzyme related to lactoylglutathione lyase
LQEVEGVDPDDVIMSPERAASRGLTSTVCFPQGNLAPNGSVIKSTAIDPSVVGEDGVYRLTGPAKVFTTEVAAIAAVKEKRVAAGDVIALICRGPMGSGMEETYQVTAALRHLSHGKHIALITDARFSGVSTGACIGHVSPEALAGGPVGKLQDGDLIEIVVDRRTLEGSLNFVGTRDRPLTAEQGVRALADRPPRSDLRPDARLPDDTRLWAALQAASGGVWGGCVYDVDRIVEVLAAGRRALERPALAHITLPTRHVERTAAFLEQVFGWTRVPVPDNSPVDLVWLDLGNGQQMHVFHVEGFEVSPFEQEFGRHIAVHHDGGDFVALKERITTHGGTLIAPQRATPHERTFFREPVNGYVFEVIAG